MRVHQMTEPGIGYLVTGCDDIEAATRAVLAEYRAELEDETGSHGPGPDYLFTPGIAIDWFKRHPGTVQVGRVVPANAYDRDEGISWWWRTGYKLGKPGVTTAVLFEYQYQPRRPEPHDSSTPKETP